jgi:hypothetical protein
MYCRALFPGTYDQLILAFKAMKAARIPENQAIDLANDGGQLAGWLYDSEFGPLAGIAAAFVATECALCAKDSAY